MIKEAFSSPPSLEQLQHSGAILPVWKHKGQSTHQIAIQAAKKWKVKCAHTGILDPLAEGVILLLLGPARLNRSYYTQQLKTYYTEVCVGLNTDSLDLLGILAVPTPFSTPFHPYTSDQLHTLLSQQHHQYIGKLQQVPPSISSIKIDGKRSQHWVKHHKKIKKLAPRSVYIKQLQLIKTWSISYQKVVQKAYQDIPLVQGVLRQEECLASWQAHHTHGTNQHILHGFSFEATVGAGCYIRSLMRDWLSDCGITSGIVMELIRTSNATFTRQDCGHFFIPTDTRSINHV